MVVKKRIAVIAYAFSPTRGSEFAQGWNYISKLCTDFDVTVFIGSSDGLMGGTSEIHTMDKDYLPPSLQIEIIAPDEKAIFWNTLNTRFRLSWCFVYALRSWNRVAIGKVTELHKDNPFHCIHHLGPVGFKTPSKSYDLDIPSYWGPIGGFQFIDLKLAWRSRKIYFFSSLVRNVLTYFVSRSRLIGEAISNYDYVSYATQTNRDNFLKIGAREGPILSDQATVDGKFISPNDKGKSEGLNIVWCGTLDARKNVQMLLDIVDGVKNLEDSVNFYVLGAGPLSSFLDDVRTEKCLKNLNVVGHVARDRVAELFMNADVLLFTSLSEANTSTFFEGLESLCIPITLDLDGFTTNVRNDIGFKISAKQSYSDIVNCYVDAIARLSREEDLVFRLREKIYQSREDFSWSALYKKHKSVIDAAVRG